MWTSAGIVVTRFDASTGTSVVLEGGAPRRTAVVRRRRGVDFPAPYGGQEVHLVPHPEPVTLPRVLDVRDVVFKVGYPDDETARIRVLLELGFDRDEPFEVDGVAVSPRGSRRRTSAGAASAPTSAARTSSRSASTASATAGR